MDLANFMRDGDSVGFTAASWAQERVTLSKCCQVLFLATLDPPHPLPELMLLLMGLTAKSRLRVQPTAKRQDLVHLHKGRPSFRRHQLLSVSSRRLATRGGRFSLLQTSCG